MKNIHRHISDDSWDNREFGATEQYVRKVSKQREKEINEKLGLQMISLRLQKTLIDKLKILACQAGIGYQPYIRQLLTSHVNGKKRNGTYD